MITRLLSLDSAGEKQIVSVDLDSKGDLVITNVPCDISVYAGAALYVSSGTAYNAIANSLATSNVIGLCDSKNGDTLCDIRVLGLTGEIFSGLDESKEYYLSDTTAGLITTVVPDTVDHIRLQLGQPLSATRFLVLRGERSIRA